MFSGEFLAEIIWNMTIKLHLSGTLLVLVESPVRVEKSFGPHTNHGKSDKRFSRLQMAQNCTQGRVARLGAISCRIFQCLETNNGCSQRVIELRPLQRGMMSSVLPTE